MNQRDSPKTARRNRTTPAVTRPLPGGRTLNLGYIRTGARSSTPVVIIPGGPGLGSIVPYRGFRRKATRHGLDIVMMEHRGVGFSRKDTAGGDLTPEDLTIAEVINDLAAVLDAENIDRAVIYGSSYGSYLAQAFGVTYPERVAAMVLDSVLLSAQPEPSSDAVLSELFWEGNDHTRHLAEMVHSLVDAGTIRQETAGFPLLFLYEAGGARSVDTMLSLLGNGRGRWLWRKLEALADAEFTKKIPYFMEFDLVGEIAFRELNYALEGTEHPLQTAHHFRNIGKRYTPFEREPFQLHTLLQRFDWPTIVLSGEHDIRTPRHEAIQVAELIPEASLISLAYGHSALDNFPELALAAMRAAVDTGSGIPIPPGLADAVRGPRKLLRWGLAAAFTAARISPFRHLRSG